MSFLIFFSVCLATSFDFTFFFYTFNLLFQKRSEKLATATVDNLACVSNLESNVVADSNGSTSVMAQSSAANSSSIVLNAEFASHVASYNIVMFYGFGISYILNF